MLRRLATLSIALLIVPCISADSPESSKLGPLLTAALANADTTTRLPVRIVLAAEPDPVELARLTMRPRNAARRSAVHRLLTGTAERSQAPLLAQLHDARNRGGVHGPLRVSWLANAISAELAPALIRSLAAREEVRSIGLEEPRGVWLDTSLPHDGDETRASTRAGTPVWSVEKIRAPELWQLGVTGEDVLVGLVDTGVAYTHPDIAERIWVNPGEDLDGDGVVMDPDDENGIDDDGNGYVDDLIGWNFHGWNNDPNDPDGHGTHVAGTIAGDGSSGDATGVAPGAKIIVVRHDPQEVTHFESWQALEYVAEQGADLVNTSWGYYQEQQPDRATIRRVIDNLLAMGTVTISAAGNAGEAYDPPYSIGTPPDVPAAIAVAATNEDDTRSSFSSVGPTTWENVPEFGDFPYPPGLAKPDLAAPGGSVRSLDIPTGYVHKSGTSMAAPHVTGAAALLMSARTLSRDALLEALAAGAHDLGDPGFDPHFGHGRIDVVAAYEAMGGRLEVETTTILDPSPQQGNGDGGLDPGERVGLRITVRNTDESASASNVRVVLGSENDVLTLHDTVVELGDIAPGATATSAAPHLSFTVDGACGRWASLQLRLTWDDGEESTTRLDLPVGDTREERLFEDDFETDQGWSTSGTSPSGHFVREDPVEAYASGRLAQPDDDHSESGTRCLVTGNSPASPNAADHDVDRAGSDEGTAIAISPRIDATGHRRAQLRYWLWCYAEGTGWDIDSCAVQWSHDDGETWQPANTLARVYGRWVTQVVHLQESDLSATMRVRVVVTDAARSETVVDGLLDDVTLTALDPECEDFIAPSENPPNPVGDSLRITRERDDLRLRWDAPAVDPEHDAASLYHILGAETPDGTFIKDASASATWHLALGEATRSRSRFYLIESRNAGSAP